MFRHILEGAIWIINAVSIMVLLWGVLLTVKNFVISEIKSKDRIEAVKKIESILNPTFHDIIVLASIVVIRTVISYFLNKEIESNKEHLEN